MAPVLTCKFMKHSIFKKRTENSHLLLVALCHTGAGSAGRALENSTRRSHCGAMPDFVVICILLSANREGPLLKDLMKEEKKD